jgi:hypothetical protein
MIYIRTTPEGFSVVITSEQAFHSGTVTIEAAWDGAIAEVSLAPSAAKRFQERPYVIPKKVIAKFDNACYVLLNFRVKIT